MCDYLVVVGGMTQNKQSIAEVLVYDPRADSWAIAARLPAPRVSASAVAVGDQIVVTGGVGPGSGRETWIGPGVCGN